MKSMFRSLSGLPRIPQESGIADHLVQSLAQLHPLSILRGPRGYGKTSAVVTWLRQAEGLPETVYTTLTIDCNEQEGFWAQLREALARVDSQRTETPSTAAECEREVTTWLAHRREPLLVIIDDFHEAGLRHGAASIDDTLVDLIRQNDQLFLVAAGRTLRALETVGSLSVETLVIGPDELRMTGEMVHALAGRMGVTMTRDRAERIVVELGGWPSAIRAGVRRAAASGGGRAGEVTLGRAGGGGVAVGGDAGDRPGRAADDRRDGACARRPDGRDDDPGPGRADRGGAGRLALGDPGRDAAGRRQRWAQHR